jgi:hypothetical protein
MKNREDDGSNDTFLNQKGGLAHLARALAWQARGDRFESDILHNTIFNKKYPNSPLFGYFHLYTLCFIGSIVKPVGNKLQNN